MALVRSILRAIRMLFTLRCDESSRLMSDAFERELTGVERWAVRLHFLSCRHCRKVRGQLARLQRLAQDRGADVATLATEARQRIRRRLVDENDSR